MLTASFIVAILVELLVPFALAIWLTRRFNTRWKLVGVGALTFIGSQIVHLPLVGVWNSVVQVNGMDIASRSTIVLHAVVLGLLAGLCEESARWIGYKLLKTKGDSWGSALTLGAGHGGIESILLAGLPVLSTFVVMHLVRGGMDIPGITPEQVTAYFSMSWDAPLAGAVERLMAMLMHITLSVLVWRAVHQRNWVWFAAAVLWHALIDALVVFVVLSGWAFWAAEGLLAACSLVNIFLLWRNSTILACASE